MAGAQIQAHITGGRCMNRALINTCGHVKGQIEGEWVEIAYSDSHVHASDNTNIIGNLREHFLHQHI